MAARWWWWFAVSLLCSCQVEDATNAPIGETIQESLPPDLAIAQLLVDEAFGAAEDSLPRYAAPGESSADPALGARLLYYRARLLYQAGQFPEALALARQAVTALERTNQVGARGVVIQCYHLLAELHADHAYYPDSVGIYQRRAADLLQPSTPAAIRAENYIGLSLDQVYTYSVSTQVTAARLGLQLLDELPQRYPDKYARLLVAEGTGIKKYADQQSGERQQALWTLAADRLALAVALFREAGSVRWREAQRERIIVVSRLRDRASFEQEMAVLLTDNEKSPTAPPPPFGFPDRLRGYFHHQSGNVDSVISYYTRFQEVVPDFDFHLRDETLWTLIQYGLRDRRVDLAERSVRDQFTLYGCCPAGEQDRSIPALLERFSFSSFGCYYALADYGRTQLARYRNGEGPQHLREAEGAFTTILDRWEQIFRTGEQESARSQLASITHRIVRNANEVALERYRLDGPTPKGADRLLGTIDRTKSFLLLNDRLAVSDSSGRRVHLDSLRRWQSEIDLLKVREFGGTPLARRDRERILDLSRRHRDLFTLAQREKLGTYEEWLDRNVSVAELRDSDPDQATLVFGEGNDRLVVQYVDADTVIAYATPPLAAFSPHIDTLITLLEGGPATVTPQRYVALTKVITSALLDPVLGALTQRRELLILPVGRLSGLPFAALLGSAVTDTVGWRDLDYLVNRIDISYAPSLRIELQDRPRRDLAYGSLAVGTWIHPELRYYFSTAVGQSPAAATKPHHRAFTGEDCQGATFRAHLHEFGILDINLHAAGNPRDPHANYLYFAPNDSLNGAAIAQLDCPAALVYLNACQTGLGTGTVAEGTFSVARSFQQLGVPDVVYSLWRIPAAASAELREGFFRALYAGESPAQALNHVQRTMVSGGRYAFPGSWAGLVKG